MLSDTSTQWPIIDTNIFGILELDDVLSYSGKPSDTSVSMGVR